MIPLLFMFVCVLVSLVRNQSVSENALKKLSLNSHEYRLLNTQDDTVWVNVEQERT